MSLHAQPANQPAPPPPDPADLARQAGKARTRRLLRAGATVVLVAAAAAVAGIHLGNQAADRAPTQPIALPSDLPNGAPPAVPYLDGATVYVRGTATSEPWTDLTVRGRWAVGVAIEGDDPPTATLVIYHDQVEIGRVEHAAQAQYAHLSWDGTKLAYVDLGASDAHLVVQDLVSDRVLGRLVVDRHDFARLDPESEAWTGIDLVDDDGTVHYGSVAGGHAWRPGGLPVKEAQQQPWEALEGYPSDAQNVQVDPDGHWGAWLRSAPGAESVADGGYADTLQAQHPDDPASRVIFRLPRHADAAVFAWESTTDVLISLHDDPNGGLVRFIRCSVTRRTCELAPRTDPAATGTLPTGRSG